MSKTTNKFFPEVRALAVRMVRDHEGEYPSRWAAIVSISEKNASRHLSARIPRPDASAS